MAIALMTGATGFLGSLIAEALLVRGYEVHCITSGITHARLGDSHDDLKWHLADSDTWRAPARDCEVFINAAVVYDRPEISDALLQKINCEQPLKIATEIRKYKNECIFIFLDSFFSKFPMSASSQPRYTASKIALFEHERTRPCRQQESVVFLRLEHLYGPRDNPGKVFPRIIYKLLSNEHRIPLTNGVQRRDFLYVTDAVNAVLKVIENGRPGFHLCECGWGFSIPIRTVFEKMKELTGSQSELGFGDIAGQDGISDSAANAVSMNAWGWSPEVPLEVGLRALIDEMSAGRS